MSSRSARTRRVTTVWAAGIAFVALSVGPPALADSADGSNPQVDPGAARNDIDSTPTVDIRRLLNDIDTPRIAPPPEPTPDVTVEHGGTEDYLQVALGALAGAACGAGGMAALNARRHRQTRTA